MYKLLFVIFASLNLAMPAMAQVSIGFELPTVNIGINVQQYPELVPVPGYPVYYASHLDSNYFFYDGMYWVYKNDSWYVSSWYNGPWEMVSPDVVPAYVLRIPARYYRQLPEYFRGGKMTEPPQWGEHWGKDWAQRRSGWNQWNRSTTPIRPPLPVYQKKYPVDRYPRQEQQRALQSQYYRYQANDPLPVNERDEPRIQTAPGATENDKDMLGSPRKAIAEHQNQIVAPPQKASRSVMKKPEPQATPVPTKPHSEDQQLIQDRGARIVKPEEGSNDRKAPPQESRAPHDEKSKQESGEVKQHDKPNDSKEDRTEDRRK